MSHCDYCADPYRAVILSLVAQGIRPAVISRHYGLRYTTVVDTAAEARRKRCLPPPKCLYCPAVVTRLGGCCEAKRCVNLYGRDYMRKRRAHPGEYGKGRKPYDAPEDFEWPVLPKNRRERTLRRPPRKKVKPSGMLVTRGAPPTSAPQGFVVIGSAPTSPIGSLLHARMAA